MNDARSCAPGFARLTLLTLSALAFLVPTPERILAQQSDLTLDRIFNSSDFRGERFGPAVWLSDDAYTTVERSASTPGADDIVRYDARTGARDVMVFAADLIPDGQDTPLEVHGYDWSSDGSLLLLYTNSQRVWRVNSRGDYWLLNRDSGALFQLGDDGPESTMMFAKFSPDDTRVGFVRENNIYVQELATRDITQLTNDGSRTIINGTFDWVYEEEFGIRDGFRWSPDGTRIAFWQLDASGVRDFLLINNTDSLYSFVIPIQYPKAGTTNSAVRVGVIPAEGGTTTWMLLAGDPRNNYVARVEWAANSDEIVMQYLNRLQNQNRVTLGDAETGAVRTVFTDEDPAWVNVVNDLLWLDGGESFTWVSERDGWRRAYRISRDGSSVEALTPADTDILNIDLIDEANGWVYYTAAPGDPMRRYLFRAPLDPEPESAERLTPEPASGWNSYQISPAGGWAIHTLSTFETPSVISLVNLPAHKSARTLVDNAVLAERVSAVKTSEVEFFSINTEDDITLEGWMMRPEDFDESRKYPVLVYVYGEPAAQTVVDRWSGPRMLWHHHLTELGYIVVSMDGRGTPSPKGRDWRKVVYGEIGTLSSRDQAFGMRALLEERPYLDADRVGIWGWSGGGSQTLNSIFRYPDVFKTGMAVAPVPDERFYDTIYQERYMGLPQDNALGYERGSPITYAGQLEGDLLIIHGTGDDNVHYQGTEALVNKLVEHNKPFTMMSYPNRSHGIFEGAGTTLHLYGLLTRFLQEHLEAGPRDRPVTF